MTDLPTIYHGIPDPGPDSDTVNAALQEIIARINKVPPHLLDRVICSVVTSVCCAQNDPASVFAFIGANVGAAIEDYLRKPMGSA